MKKVIFTSLALVLVALFTSCGINKGLVSSSIGTEDSIDAEIKRLEKENRLRELKNQARIDSINLANELALAESRHQNLMYGTSLRLEQKIHIPCIELSYDKSGEYMAGLGISEGQRDRKDALLAANKAAITDIVTRYVGTIKNGSSYFSKDLNGQNSTSLKESDLEGIASNVGKSVIETHAEAVCREFAQDKYGNYVGYVVVHVPVAKVVDETLVKLDELKVNYDKEKMKKFLEGELDSQAQEKQKEADALELYKKSLND